MIQQVVGNTSAELDWFMDFLTSTRVNIIVVFILLHTINLML